MPTYPWESFLMQWNNALFDAVDINDYALPPDVTRSRWLGFSGAAETQLAAAEARLGIDGFPPSYRQFLTLTNGWRHTGTFIDRLWSTEDVDWLRVRNGHLIENFSPYPDLGILEHRYFDYDDDEAATYIRTEHLKTLLEISDVGDAALYLLNPNVINEDEEWEAWFYASWLPGFRRYPSFWAMMQSEYKSFKRLEARRRIERHPRKASAILREIAPELIEELERVAKLMGNHQHDAAQTPLEASYIESYVGALQDAAQRVQKLTNVTPNAKAFVTGLRQLIIALEREAHVLQPTMSLSEMSRTGADSASVTQTISNGGAMASKRMAADIIQQFLNP